MLTESGLVWRAITTRDAAAWAALLAAAEAVDATEEHFSVEDLLEELADPALEIGQDTVAAFAGSAMVAYGLVRRASTVRDRDLYDLEGCVHPSHRRRRLGSAVLARLAERAAHRHRQQHPELPGQLQLRLHDGNRGSAALARLAGLSPVRYWYHMARELTGLDSPPAAGGLRVVGYHRDRDNAVRRARNEAFADHWGFVQRDEADWRHWYTGSRSFRPALSALVLDGAGASAEIAAFLLSYEYEADVAASGVRVAWIGQLGTRPAWRGRGLASALIGHVLAGYAASGYQRAALVVDTANPTGALGLYRRAGFVPTARWTTFSRPL